MNVDQWRLNPLTTGEQIVEQEYCHVCPDGGHLIIRSGFAPISDGEARIVAGRR